jgi:hypothetical protein
MGTSNYITRLVQTATKSDLWNTYGFILQYVGSGDFPVSTRKLYGIYNTDFDMSNGVNLETPADAGLATQGAKGAIKAGVDYISSKIKGPASNIIGAITKDKIDQGIGHSISESIKLYESGNGRPQISITTFFVPGLFNFKDYSVIEQWAAYSTLPKKMGSELVGYSQHIYDPKKRALGGAIDLSSDLFAIKLNNLINVPGGMYITSFRRTYSNDRDENGKPIYCKVDITLEYYREMFADEFLKLFSEF